MPVSHSHQFLCVSFSPRNPRDQHGIGGIGDVPDLMRLAAESPQHVDRVAIALRQRLAVADPHHLRAAGFILAFLARKVAQIFGLRGIGDVDDRGAVRLGLAGLRIDRRRNIVAAAVMADIGDPAVALMMDGRLIGAARLQVAGSNQLHVGASGGAPITCCCAQAMPEPARKRIENEAASLRRPLMFHPDCSRPICVG